MQRSEKHDDVSGERLRTAGKLLVLFIDVELLARTTGSAILGIPSILIFGIIS